MSDRHFLIDPFVLAVPQAPAEAAAYVNGLVTWLPALTQSRDECSCFEALPAILMEEGRFPTRETLGPILAHSSTIEYSAVDLLRMVGLLAATEPFFEHFIDRRVAVGEAVVQPSSAVDRLGERLGAATKDALMLAATAHHVGWCPERTYWATSTWGDGDNWIHVFAQVDLVERMNGDVEEIGLDLTARLKVLTATEEVEFGRTLVDVYREPAKAVALLLHQLRQFDAAIPAKVTVGASPEFISSLEAAQLQHQPAILATVYERAAFAALGRLAEVAGAKLHPVRRSAAADSPQVERLDGAKLWRCMVTKAGAGYRLQYWKLDGGAIELSEILTESEV